MEPPVQTYVPNQQILAAELNEIQQRALGMAPAASNNVFAALLGVIPSGWTAFEWAYYNESTFATTLATGETFMVDDTLDWRDRVVVLLYAALGSGRAPSLANDYLFDVAMTLRKGYTGLGGLDAGSVAPTAGNPPVPASTTSWAPTLATNLFLYAHPTTGALWIYNNTGGNVVEPSFTVFASPQLGARP